jgi:hypothetical protein
MEGIKRALAELERRPQQADLIVGYLGLCKIIKSTPEQVAALTCCSKALLEEHPLLALNVLKIALMLEPADPDANAWLQSVLRRRGRWTTEHRLAELSRTTLKTSALSPAQSEPVFMPFEQDTSESAQLAPSSPISTQNEVPMSFPAAESNLSHRDLGRAEEFLNRCGFNAELIRYAQGMSDNNCGLVTFVGILQRLGLVKPNDMQLALHMLQKMIEENPDNSEARQLYTQMFEPESQPSEGEP